MGRHSAPNESGPDGPPPHHPRPHTSQPNDPRSHRSASHEPRAHGSTPHEPQSRGSRSHESGSRTWGSHESGPYESGPYEPRSRGLGSRAPVRRGRLAAVVIALAGLLAAGLVFAGLPPYRTVVHGTGTLAGGEPVSQGRPTPPPPSPTSPPPSTPAVPAGQVTFAFAGDVHFAGRTAGRAGIGAGVLGPISRTLAAADIGMVNLETAITERGTEEPKQYHFRAPATALDSLRAAGLDVVTMANNHAVDYGPVGLQDTLSAIATHRLPVIGVGANAARAYAPWYATVRGTRIAIIAASQVHDRTMAAWTAGDTTPGIASATSPRLLASVREARRQAAIVVVYLHWGTEGNACPNSEQRAVAQALSDAGADAVVGTHAHLLLGAGWLGHTYVDYGLGNFLWWLDNAYSNDTGVLTLTFHNRTVVRSTFTPAEIDPAGVPQPATGAIAARVLAKLEQARRCAGLAATATG